MAGARGVDGSGEPDPDRMLGELCRDYWPPIYAFIRSRGTAPADAEDLTQDFFAYLIETKAHWRADPARGKFRTFLLFVLKRFLSADYARKNRIKRGGQQQFVVLDEEMAEVEALCASDLKRDHDGMDERKFDWNWADALARRSLKVLAAEYATGARIRVFDELKPFLTGGLQLPSQEQAAAHLCIPVETLRSHLSRLRSRYGAILRDEVARTIEPGGDVEGELRYLCEVLVAAA